MAVNSTASQKKDKLSKKTLEKKKPFTELMIALVIIVAAIVFVLVSGTFDVAEIVVENNQIISAEKMISFSGIQKGTNIFAVSKKNVKNRLKELSYINDVKIRRIWPNQIELEVEERTVDFALQLAGSYVYIDKQG